MSTGIFAVLTIPCASGSGRPLVVVVGRDRGEMFETRVRGGESEDGAFARGLEERSSAPPPKRTGARK